MLGGHYVLTKSNDIFALERVSKRGNLIANASEPPNIGLEVVLLILDDFWSEVKRSAYPAEESCIGLDYLGYS